MSLLTVHHPLPRQQPRPIGVTRLRVALAVLLLLHVMVWAWAASASRSNLDLTGDMLEAYAWGQAWQWGYFKHPPLSAWMSGLWFSVWPATNASYGWLAALNTAVGLAGFAVLCREYLQPRWVLVCVAAALLAPGATTLAMRFNPNAVLVSTWPWAVAFFVRTMHRGLARDAFACGVACALAVLGKYFSGVLMVSLLLAALVHAPWRARLTGPLLAWAALGFLLLAGPHLLWLIANDLAPIAYAKEATGQAAAKPGWRAVNFVVTQLAFPVFGVGLMAFCAVRARRVLTALQVLGRSLQPSREPLWLLAWLPIGLTALATWLLGARTSVLWGLPMTMGVLLLVAHRMQAQHGDTPRLKPGLRYLVLVWLVVALLSPALWLWGAHKRQTKVTEPREELALAIDAAWQQRHAGSLPWVTGTRALAAATAFYAPSHPGYWSAWNVALESPWVDTARISRDGGALVCGWEDLECQQIGVDLGATLEPLTVKKSVRGHVFAPVTYAVFWLAPQAYDLTALPAFERERAQTEGADATEVSLAPASVRIHPHPSTDAKLPARGDGWHQVPRLWGAFRNAV